VRISLPHDDPEIMPPEGERPLAKAQIELIKRWIDEGADWPQGAAADAEATEHKRPPPLAVRELTPAEQSREQAARAAIEKRGGLALRIAADTHAVDVNWSLLGKQVVDADLALLAGLEPTLVWLNVSRTSVTDAGLAAVAQLTELRRLNLSQTAVGDGGLTHLQHLAKLEYLNLYDTAVGDAGLARLHGLRALRRLYLWQTKATDAGVDALQKALPELTIDRGGYAELMQRVAEQIERDHAAKKPVNAKCPLTGKPVNAEFTLEHEGEVIGFCCGNCKAEFFKDPQAHIGKLERTAAAAPVAKEAPKVPVNAKCPLTGKAVSAEFVVEHEGRWIGFCCGNCKAKFEKDPKPFQEQLEKLKNTEQGDELDKK
jgi:YHS domain-containing protein